VEGSVLWLFEDNAAARRHLGREAQHRGVDPSRLVFAPRMNLAEHLARQRRADLFLDTFYYNAHTTTSDALWAGLPVLTCLGNAFAGRVAASLLQAVGLPELITHNHDDYEALALKLATRPDSLAAVKHRLDHQRLTQPLFDSTLFTAHIETAYTLMWQRHLMDAPPEHLRIPS
jgi:protein O-GlcNAc transferase